MVDYRAALAAALAFHTRKSKVGIVRSLLAYAATPPSPKDEREDSNTTLAFTKTMKSATFL